NNVTISGNQANSVAGAGNLGTLLMTNVTISGNKAIGADAVNPAGTKITMARAGLGGGLANGAVTKMAYATISDNSAVGIGGGGVASATVVIDAIKERQDTIAAVLGHPFAFPTAAPTTVAQSTIVANSTAGGN